MSIIPPFVSGTVRGLQALWQRFRSHQGTLWASALSFDTALALVPLLALVFVGLQLAGIQNLLEPFLLRQLAGDSQESAARILNYISRIQVGALGFGGVTALLVSLFFLLETMCEAFNAVWGVAEHRSLVRRCLNYLLLTGAVPLLLTVALGLTSILQSRLLVQWLISSTALGAGVLLLFRLVPFFCIVLVLMLTYLLLPAVKVRFRSALVGGLLSGAVWQLAHWVYFRFQFGLTRYNILYGALALLPFLLIWIYTSWLLVLMGLELVRCHQQHEPVSEEPLSLER